VLMPAAVGSVPRNYRRKRQCTKIAGAQRAEKRLGYLGRFNSLASVEGAQPACFSECSNSGVAAGGVHPRGRSLLAGYPSLHELFHI
jgi:hypothetical protein